MQHKLQRFFIGIEVPSPINQTIDRWRAIWYPHGLKTVPPHITVVPPFYASAEDRPAWQQITRPFSVTQSCTIHLNNFSAFFHTKCVFFVRVEDSAALEYIHKSFESRLARQWPRFQKSQRPYHPHVTIANRLSSHQLDKIQQDLQHQPLDEKFLLEEIIVYRKTLDGPYQKYAVIHLDNCT
jgi:2'-5' RNA ligase